MRLRQARKIMKNVRLYPGMIWVYGNGRVGKANKRMCRYHSKGDGAFKTLYHLSNEDPLAFFKLIKTLREKP